MTGYSQVKLTKGCMALVDDADVHRVLAAGPWSATRKPRYTTYAIHTGKAGGKTHSTLLHRFILGVTDPNVDVDHINGDGLDNRRENLRLCTASQNRANAGKRRHPKATSEYKGVSWLKANKRWRARLMLNEKDEHLGLFDSEEDAARAYDKAARELFGEFALCNFTD